MPAVTLASHVGVRILATPLAIELPIDILGKQRKMTQVWRPGDPEKLLAALTVVAVWAVN